MGQDRPVSGLSQVITIIIIISFLYIINSRYALNMNECEM